MNQFDYTVLPRALRAGGYGGRVGDESVMKPQNRAGSGPAP